MNKNKHLEQKLREKISRKADFDCSKVTVCVDDHNIARLTGMVESWQNVVDLGYLIAKEKKIKNVVNDVKARRAAVPVKDWESGRLQGEKIGVIACVDVVIVGGGVTGCGIARELARYDLNIALVEKEADVSEGSSKANNGMIHPGNAVMPFTLKAKMNLEGNKLYTNWADDLHFSFKRTGSLIISYSRNDLMSLLLAYIAGKINRVPGMQLLGGKSCMDKDPSIEKKPGLGLWTPTTAYVDGYEVCIALAENAAANGVRFFLDTTVCAIHMDQGRVTAVVTDQGIINCRLVINAAGVYADDVAQMADDRFFTIHPRKGSILILDKKTAGPQINVALSSRIKNKYSKGGGGLRTVSGNPLWGPSAREVPDKEDTSVISEDFDYAYQIGSSVFEHADRSDIISYFSGIRAPDYKEDFVIEESAVTDGLIHAAAIQSPGLAAAPAVARRVVSLTKSFYARTGRQLKLKDDFDPVREKPQRFAELSHAEQERLIKENPQYGNVICRCETITEGEIVAALHSPLPCRTVTGVKKRTRASAGRCQGGFCTPKIMEIMVRELQLDITDITYKGAGSNIILRKSRGDLEEKQQ